MDLMFWGGPVYCSTVQKIEWKRPTYVFCHPLDGAANVTYASQLTAAGAGSPLDAMLATAAQESKGAFDPAQVGSIGLSGFSAAHQLLNPILKVDGDRARVDYVHLADSCFLGAGATSPHVGYAKFAAEAIAGGKMMTVTSHGPRGDIHYSGPDGTPYNLTSGTQCVQLFWDSAIQIAAMAGITETVPELPPGMPTPTEAHRLGNLIWFGYDNAEHGDHANKFAQPMIEYYGVPWMAGERPFSIDKYKWPAVALAIVLGAWWYARRY